MNFADDCVRSCYSRKGAIFENWPDTLFVALQYGGWAGSSFFIGQKSDSLVPGVAASQDILKVFFRSEFGVESDS